MIIYTTKQVAAMLELSVRRVQKAAPELAEKLGHSYIWTEEAVEKLKARKGKVGNPNWIKKR